MESFAIIIPARYASTRFPGKPLAPLRGHTGLAKPLIQRSWECARSIEGTVGIWVATDDERIANAVRGFGGEVVMTSPDCANGTERCANAIEQLGPVADVIVNLQGDAPLSPGYIARDLVARLGENPRAVMATLGVRCSQAVLSHLLEDHAQGRVGGTTVVCDNDDRALYFSKSIVPFVGHGLPRRGALPVHLHLGMYAYRPDALAAYRAARMSDLERVEGLEQLRFLSLGLNVSVVRLDALPWDSIELNNPSDTGVIERILSEKGIV